MVRTKVQLRHAKISVGMPVYNGGEYLEAAIESVLAQSYGDFELNIVDNASTDATQDICETLAVRDSRINYSRNAENIGAARNYNLAFGKSNHEYFRWHNADDLIHKNCHLHCLKALEAHPEAVLAAGTTILIDKNAMEIERYNDNLGLTDSSPAQRLATYFDRVGLTNVIYGLMRRDAVAKGPVFGLGDIPAADIRFMAILCLQGSFIQLEEPLFYRRMHDTSSSSDRQNEQLQTTFWSGNGGSFKRSGWKTLLSYWSACFSLDASFQEKTSVSAYLFRRMVWQRRELLQELMPVVSR